ncbi:hypothetical protein SAMN05444422_104194 [Halobiforma haloterrestris]|uniref:SpoIIAA-like n=1 Tax=Natronobacterium haloterrestre TaxID=148448 RepID=A0A1I1GBM1_NATHA|nr:hypothetical protein [Halobiforma haloterrestris]SFC08722.1 hypothetical protein SAMN05444422_104194 [Halobiforma haloterrestris]
MDLEAFETEAYPVYEDLLAERDVETLVTVVELEEPFTREAFEVWERAALKASDAGVDRWALVADGAKALSLRGQIDVGDLDVCTTEERTEAFAWAETREE